MAEKKIEHRISVLLTKHLQGEINEDESKELSIWRSEDPENGELFNELTNSSNLNQELFEVNGLKERMKKKIFEKVSPAKVRRMWPRWAAAAAILILIAGSYFLFFNKSKTEPLIAKVIEHDVKAPEANRAMITMTNGKTVYLDSVSNGTLATEGNVKLVKLEDGKIAYTGTSSETLYNTLSNPRGSKVIDMTLADGSHVWLNAGSSVTYPVTFNGDERKVKITGEAYFEVEHDATKPFIVTKGETSITVLGTHFNVNAYDDEDNIKVTLLQGSVKVNNSTILKPGEQAQISNEIRVLKGVDVERIMAWKNGKFEFGESTDLKSIMRQVARWYDVEVTYSEDINQSFGGSISRQVNVSKVLEKFELTGKVHFKIEGKKITVSK